MSCMLFVAFLTAQEYTMFKLFVLSASFLPSKDKVLYWFYTFLKRFKLLICIEAVHLYKTQNSLYILFIYDDTESELN